MVNVKEINKQLGYYVVKSNDLIRNNRFMMTLQQQKLILFAISKIKSDDDPNQEYVFNMDDLCAACGINIDDTGTYYQRIKADLSKLTERKWVMFQDNSEGTISWFSDAKLDHGLVKVTFHKEMAPYLVQLKSHYTQYQLADVLVLKGKYSIRLYELLRSFLLKTDIEKEREKEIDFEVDQLREYLSADMYSSFREFNRYVIKRSIDEINEYSSELKISYDVYKTGKKATKIVFLVTYPNEVERRIANDNKRHRLWVKK